LAPHKIITSDASKMHSECRLNTPLLYYKKAENAILLFTKFKEKVLYTLHKKALYSRRF